jgi:hypothetical protein
MPAAQLFPALFDARFVRSEAVAETAAAVLAEHGEVGGIARLFDVRRAVNEDDLTIAYVLDTKPFDPLSPTTHDAVAKCIKAPPVWHDITGVDVVIAVRQYFWDAFDADQRGALLVHELLHVDASYDENGELVLAIRKHDLEEFDDVAAKYGAALPAIAPFIRAFGKSQDPAAPLRDIVDDPASGITSITVSAGGKSATIRGRRSAKAADDEPEVAEAARPFTAEQGAAALDELNRDLDGL